MRETSIIAVVSINFFILQRHCWLIWKDRIKPAMAMWVFFSIAVGGSLASYLSSGDYSFLDNIQNTTDLVFVLTVTVFVFIFGDRSTRFNTFDLGCLIAVLVIVVLWLIFQNHVVSNVSIQVILVIAYFSVISRTSNLKRITREVSIPSIFSYKSRSRITTTFGLIFSIFTKSLSFEDTYVPLLSHTLKTHITPLLLKFFKISQTSDISVNRLQPFVIL